MEKTYYIILPQFNSLAEASNYFLNSEFKFSFAVNSNVYDENGNEILEPTNFEIIPIEQIGMQIYDSNDFLSPGQTHIKDGFIQYFKELKL